MGREERGKLASGVGSEDQGVVTTTCAILRAETGTAVTIRHCVTTLPVAVAKICHNCVTFIVEYREIH